MRVEACARRRAACSFFANAWPGISVSDRGPSGGVSPGLGDHVDRSLKDDRACPGQLPTKIVKRPPAFRMHSPVREI